MFTSGPSQYLAIVYAIIIVLSIITLIIQAKQNSTFQWSGLFSIILMALLFLLIIYDTDCLTVGGCTTWGLVRAIFYSIIPVIVIVLALYGYMTQLDNKPKKEEEVKTEEKFI